MDNAVLSIVLISLSICCCICWCWIGCLDWNNIPNTSNETKEIVLTIKV